MQSFDFQAKRSGNDGHLSVVALTSTNTEKHLTYKLRVELLLPFLREQNISVDTFWIPRERKKRHELFERLGNYDAVWLHRHTFTSRDVSRLKTVVPNLVFDFDDPVGYSSHAFANFSLSKALRFRAVARNSDAILAASDGLVELGRRYNRNVHFVPLCADPDSHSMRVQPRDCSGPFRLIWVGGRSTFTYLEQCRPQLEAVGAELPGVELVVVGHSQLSLENMPVENFQWSPEVEVEQLNRCHLGLAPLSNDRWTRAKAALKPLQYLANGMPFLGPPVGVLNRLADGGRNAFLVQTPQQWIEAVSRVQSDEGLRQEMGHNGIGYIRRFHSPDVLAEKVGAVFHSLGAPKSSSHHERKAA